jgi:hypothetical protein
MRGDDQLSLLRPHRFLEKSLRVLNSFDRSFFRRSGRGADCRDECNDENGDWVEAGKVTGSEVDQPVEKEFKTEDGVRDTRAGSGVKLLASSTNGRSLSRCTVWSPKFTEGKLSRLGARDRDSTARVKESRWGEFMLWADKDSKVLCTTVAFEPRASSIGPAKPTDGVISKAAISAIFISIS